MFIAAAMAGMLFLLFPAYAEAWFWALVVAWIVIINGGMLWHTLERDRIRRREMTLLHE